MLWHTVPGRKCEEELAPRRKKGVRRGAWGLEVLEDHPYRDPSQGEQSTAQGYPRRDLGEEKEKDSGPYVRLSAGFV